MVVLILSANSTSYEGIFNGAKITIARGQLLTSLESLRQKIGKGATIQKIRTALKNLEKYGFITNRPTKVARLITVVNYGKYQDANNGNTKHISGQPTEFKQSYNKEVTPNNKDNKEKKEINIKKAGLDNSGRREVKSGGSKARNYIERDYSQDPVQEQIKRNFYGE